jgi:hypothetical protein
MSLQPSRRRRDRLARRTRALREFRPGFHPLEPRQLMSGVASYAGRDAATQGAWRGVYGAEGFDLPLDASGSDPTLPAYAQLGFAGETIGNAGGTPTDPRLLEPAVGPGADPFVWYAADSFAIDVRLSDGATHLLALYALDAGGWGGGASERIDLVDDASGAVLDTRSVSGFQGGVYLAWDVSGDVTVRVTSLNPAAEALLSGLFLGAMPPWPRRA